MENDLSLDNPRWEAFANARAREVPTIEAARIAGYAKPNQSAASLERRPEIRGRIGVILERRRGGGSPDLGGLIDRLIALADKAAETADARAIDVARGCLAEAGRLKQLLPAERPAIPPPPLPRQLTLAEWRVKHDPTYRADDN